MTMGIRRIRAMSAPQVFNQPLQRVSDAWDWITPEEVVRHALAGYYATCRRMQKIAGECDGLQMVDRAVFGEDLYLAVGLQIMQSGFDKGVCEFWSVAPKKIREFNLESVAPNIEEGQK